ncbi:MAG: RNA polymerase subunit sigma-70, partial [Ilumatobacteraceae bacterium]
LDTTVASVNSALQRARATLADTNVDLTDATESMDDDQQALLDRYVDAFERYDVDSLTSLLHEDATLSMPPYDLWLQGHRDISGWLLGEGLGCRGSRMIPVSANGSQGFGQYRPSGPHGSFEPWALQVIEVSGDRISGINSFLDTARLFPLFGLPPTPQS